MSVNNDPFIIKPGLVLIVPPDFVCQDSSAMRMVMPEISKCIKMDMILNGSGSYALKFRLKGEDAGKKGFFPIFIHGDVRPFDEIKIFRLSKACLCAYASAKL